jgi:hypothetical protein
MRLINYRGQFPCSFRYDGFGIAKADPGDLKAP